jgi:hypothetical protein
MMTAELISIRTMGNRQRRDFITDGMLSNETFRMIHRNWPHTHTTTVGKVPMDMATLRMVNQLFESPAIYEISLDEQSVSIMLNEFFLWSEVQDWVLYCIKCRFSRETREFSPAIDRRAIGVSNYLSNGSAQYFYVSGFVRKKGYHNLELKRDLLGRLSTYNTDKGVESEIKLLVQTLQANAHIDKVTFGSTYIDIQLHVGFTWTENLNNYVITALCAHLGWNRTDVVATSYRRSLTGGYTFLKKSDHPIDQLVND